MELNTISGLAIAGVICSVVLSMGVPIALFIAGRVKLKARISSFFIGAGTYLLFAMLLEQLLHVLVIQFCGLNAQSRPWLYYVYAALAAAVFEETGRLIAMKFWMKKWLDFPNALMYGIGHGGVEAILEFAGLEKDVVLTGNLNRIEVWSKEKWNEICDYDDMDSIAESMQDMGITI